MCKSCLITIHGHFDRNYVNFCQKLFCHGWNIQEFFAFFPCLCISGTAEIMKPYLCGRQHLHISYLKSAVPFSSLYFRVTEGHFVLSPASHTIELSSFVLFMARRQVAPPFPQRSCHTLPRADGYFRALGPFIVISHKQQHTHAQKTHTRILINTERMICVVFPHSRHTRQE